MSRDLGTLIDAAIVSCALALPTWILLVGPAVTGENQSLPALMLKVANPLGDVAVLVLLARLVVGGGIRNTSLGLFAGAMAGWLTGDVVNAVLAAHDDRTGYWGGWLYCVSYVLVGAAALHPSMARLTDNGEAPVTRLTVRRLAVLAGMSVLPPSILLIQAHIGEHTVSATAIGVSRFVQFLLVVARMAGLIRRVEEQARTLADLAAKDGLTGVGNRRSWDAALLAGTGSGRALTVVLLDLDHFKRYNDAYGHQAGDQLLKGATGMAAWDGMETPTELVARADAALYRAKENGRDRTESARAVERV
ncbi:GGDEF domain-containing protein [Micromonosporaceae bacterium Da 78-11]